MGEGGRNYGGEGGARSGAVRALPGRAARKAAFASRPGKGGCLDVPPDVAEKLGLEPGAELEVIVDGADASRSGPTSTACPGSTSSRPHAAT